MTIFSVIYILLFLLVPFVLSLMFEILSFTLGVLVCRIFTLFFSCRAVAKYLQLLFEKEAKHGRKVVPMDNLLVGKTRKEASRMFFEALVRFTLIF